MRIGVFGDSFVNKGCETWAHRLQSNHGHDVLVFGESGSSLLWSARAVDYQYADYDLVIWAVTNPGRLSVNDTDKWCHLCEFDTAIRDPAIDLKRKIYRDYRKFVFDWHDECWQWKHIMHSMMDKCGNLLLVPCFQDPLNVSKHLYGLCGLEAEIYFPGKSVVDIYKEWDDLRPGHLSPANHDILAEDLNQKLTPGIYEVDYDMFVMPTEPVNCYWRKR
jgi:hypothetical protein